MPAESEGTIEEKALRDLILAGGRLTLLGVRGGYLLQVALGSAVRTLASTRGAQRVFAKLDTACGLATRLGATILEVNAAEFEPARLRKPRPDRAEALRKTRTRPQQQALV